MSFSILDISYFRNISKQHFEFIPHINVICGRNGSGKTSILESIFFLTHGRSFRSRKIDRIVQYQQQNLVVLGHLRQENETFIQVAVEKSIDGRSKLKLANDPIATASEITKLQPLLLINPDSYKILELGPKYRRQFLDWGLFHVEQRFFSLWKRYNRVLKQRNSGLKQELSQGLVKSWDQELVPLAEEIDSLRSGYIAMLAPLIQTLLQEFVDIEGISFNYLRGWSQKSSLSEVLEQSLIRDFNSGYTHSGPHRADLQIKLNEAQAHEILSRGQQKLLIFALRLAQGMLLKQVTGKSCCYLIDDMPAELDHSHQLRVMSILAKLQGQVMLTGVDMSVFKKLLGQTSYRMFHVEQGQLVSVVDHETSLNGVSL